MGVGRAVGRYEDYDEGGEWLKFKRAIWRARVRHNYTLERVSGGEVEAVWLGRKNLPRRGQTGTAWSRRLTYAMLVGTWKGELSRFHEHATMHSP